MTFTKQAANRVNHIVIQHLFSNHSLVAIAKLDNDLPPTALYIGMRIIITRNLDKLLGIVNGQSGVINNVHNHSIFLTLPDDRVVAIQPVTEKRDNLHETFYPISLAYAMTICKSQGQTVSKVLLWFDIDEIPPGTAYVALSRVKSKNDIHFLTRLKPQYFTPVTPITQMQ